MHCLKKMYPNSKWILHSHHTIRRKVCSSVLGLSVFLLMMSTSTLQAQNRSLSVDEQYEQARNAAFEEGDYDRARELAYDALDRSPNYHGIRIFIASLYAWEGRFDKASEELKSVLEADPENRRALLSIIDIESKAGNSSEALIWASKAKGYFPDDQEFLMKEAGVHFSVENYFEAESLYRVLLSSDPSSTEARLALQTVRLKQMKHTASLSYRHERFDQIFDPWNFMEFSLSRQTNLGAIIGRVQYANRFATNGVQFNIDAYPVIYSGLYAYISAGFSDSSIYPGTRFDLSLYKSLPWAMELEGGIRYLKFSSSETEIYTFSLSKYWGSYLLTGRTNIIPYSGDISQSVGLLARRYFGDADTYFGLSGGYGSAPSEVQFAEDLNGLTSWSVSAEAQYLLGNRFLIGASGGYDSEEFTNFTRNRTSVRAYTSYRF